MTLHVGIILLSVLIIVLCVYHRREFGFAGGFAAGMALVLIGMQVQELVQ